MNLKKGDKLPDAKVFIFDGNPKETSINQIVAGRDTGWTCKGKVSGHNIYKTSYTSLY